jgi:hypothetical protein
LTELINNGERLNRKTIPPPDHLIGGLHSKSSTRNAGPLEQLKAPSVLSLKSDIIF